MIWNGSRKDVKSAAAVPAAYDDKVYCEVGM
jgi:hypothetical protein